MTRKRKASKLNIPMCAAVVLICLTMFSFHFTSGLYAKYSTDASGSDSARVISFGEITLTEIGGNYDKFTIIPGVDITKDAEVSFAGSESAAYVYVSVTVSSHWTSSDDITFTAANGNISWSIDNTKWNYLTKYGSTYVYYHDLIEPNSSISDVDVIKDGTVTVSKMITRTELKTLENLTVTIKAATVQANGFDKPEDGWNSIKD